MSRFRIGSLFAITFIAVTGIFFAAQYSHVESQSAPANASLSITKSADKQSVQADSTPNTVKYTLAIKNLAKCDSLFNAMLVFDRSGSMDDDGGNPPQPVYNAYQAVKAFLNNADLTNSKAGLVSYSTNARVDVQLTNDKSLFDAAFNQMRPDGYTNIYEAITFATQALGSAPNPVMILFSDGVANRPLPEASAPGRAIQAAAEAKAKGIRVIAIALGKSADINTMKSISSPGDFYYAPTSEQLITLYANLGKSFSGISTGTQITDDVTDLLSKMDFVSADNGGRLNGNKLIWDIGEIDCEGAKQVTFVAKAKECAVGGSISNHGLVSNATGFSAKSSTISTKVQAPNLTISLDDGVSIARPGDKLNYTMNVKNTGDGIASGVTLQINFSEFVTVPAECLGGATQIGKNVYKFGFDLNPGESKPFDMCAVVKTDIPDGYTNSVTTASLNNNCGIIEASDQTQLFKQATPAPDYDVYAYCVDRSKEKYVGYFGYENKLSIDQTLDESTVLPVGLAGDAPSTLNPGKQDKAFSVVFESNTNPSWKTVAKNVAKGAEITTATPDCGTTPVAPVLPPVPVYNPGDLFVGGPKVTQSPTPGNNLPPKVDLGNVSTPNVCQVHKIYVDNCGALDSDGTIAAMQYSVNGGKSWYNVTDLRGLGTSKAKCSFSTPALRDGNYVVKVRALDNNNNIGFSTEQKVNINCAGIVIGSSQFNQGEILSPDNRQGMVQSFVGQPQYMAIAVEGGPISVDVITQKDKKEVKFPLSYNPKLELWEGDLMFEQPGVYQLLVVAKEANGKSTQRHTNAVQAVNKPRVVDEGGKELADAKLTLYYRQNLSDTWVQWSGSVWHLNNPTSGSEFKFVMEPGWYYIVAEHDGYFTTTTKQFYVAEDSIWTSDVTLYHNSNLLSWFNSLSQSATATLVKPALLPELQDMLGKQLPDISISDGKHSLLTKDILSESKPFVLITWTNWDTMSSAHWHNISDLFAGDSAIDQTKYGVYPIGLLEGREENEVIKLRGQYDFPIYKPVDLSFFNLLNIISAPQYFFVDSRGIVKDIQVGPISAAEIASHLQKLDLPVEVPTE